MAILDMRGPDVILREGFDEDGAIMKKKKKKGNVQNFVGENSVVGAMKWVVSGLAMGEWLVSSWAHAEGEQTRCRDLDWLSLTLKGTETAPPDCAR